ncbi:uncharacterized protein LOC132809443 isoform X1 [Hemiscyllium ocellatum]|uniref:uncharacterized protein LOC132809443 isoform X1 n=1 Tax=Hemiscyllium ocellatum TaxID=170820 RepID=UPI0029672C48|nr:uncharacterized protein LOC132809443 isoform X1 [Hemiscyllium ocellatum]
MWWRNSIVTQTLENRTASVTSQNQGRFPSQYRALLATNGHKPIKGESDGEPDRAVSGCIKQDGVDITHGDGVPQEIKLFLINNGNVSQDQVEDNDQEIRRCHGPQVSVLAVWNQNWLASRRQRVVVEGKYSAWKSVNPCSVETSPSAQQVHTNLPKSNLPMALQLQLTSAPKVEISEHYGLLNYTALGCGRKREHPSEAHARKGRRCKLHTDSRRGWN